MANAAHHKTPEYRRESKIIRDLANADPTTKCGRCGLTLDQHRNTRKGNPPQWTAGHINPGQINGPLRPEVDVCNYEHGQTIRGQDPHTERW